ncbi:gibberellin-regulated protein 14 [Cucumis sativus]|uniref:Gibberellin-regulated protein 14 n=1 Tax=Cucumis sativus TaxID=3659 RepID=A0A0A0LFE6_CUCSA|nr:gibberellin-regulated protein 14 [Cucumis sativus]KGN59629.1 hypothetical protein Csa_001168 [Cucumis sativus]
MALMANLFVFSVLLLSGSWVSANANANGLSQKKDAVYPHVPVPVQAPSTPVYKAPPVKPPTIPVLTPPPASPVKPPTIPVLTPPPAPPVKPPTIPVLTPPPVKAPYTPAPPVKLPPPPYTPSPPVKPPSSPPPAKAPYTPSPPVKPPSTPVPPVKPPSPAAPRPPPVLGKACYPECGRRCQLHSRKKICLRACLTCCDRCKCVPPGTYGNREVCGKCYTDMTTHGSRSKCP